MGLLPLRSVTPAFLLLLYAASGIPESGPAAILWTAPAILASALMIAWAAESAQFFIAQGFALAILAWMQTLPEFAVEAVIAWHRETHLLLASLTGALRLLTGLGWPVIYFTAAMVHRRRTRTPLRNIKLDEHHAVEVVGLAVPLLYFAFVIWKGSLTIWDSVVLIGIYAAYLLILGKMPTEDPETIDELESIPRRIVTSPRPLRIALITALFLGGGLLIYYSAEPFLASLLALSTVAGVPAFVFLQWITPIASEFPEMASTFYWARTVDRAPMALMNMVSSNINQWSLLPALLPVLLSISAGSITPIVFDERQSRELVMTLGQALVGLMFLVNMELAFWEATVLFTLFLIPFAYAPAAPFVTAAYFIWACVEVIRTLLGKRRPRALTEFAEVWKTHITQNEE
jgi:cation:H+ antiporter